MKTIEVPESDVKLKPEDVKPEDRVKFMVDELRIRIETYRSYINLVLQINLFFYVTTGAVLGFYLKGPGGQATTNHWEYFLWLPILIGTVLSGIFIHGAKLQGKAAENIEVIRQQLNDGPKLNIKEIPDIHLLRLLFLIFGIIFFIAGAALIMVPSMKTFTSLQTLNFFPEDLMFFTVGGLVVLVGGWTSTYLFLHVFYKKSNDARKVATVVDAEQENQNLLKSALVEALEEERDSVRDIVEEAMEDNGEEVVIDKDDHHIVKLVPVARVKPRPQFGSAKGLITMSDDFDEPLEDFEEYMK